MIQKWHSCVFVQTKFSYSSDQDVAVLLWWLRVRDHPGGGLPIPGAVEKKTWWAQTKEAYSVMSHRSSHSTDPRSILNRE